MKRTIISFSIAFLVAASLIACQKEKTISPVVEYPSEMNFNILSPGIQTKVNGTGFENGDRIGVFVTDYVDATTPMPLQISGNRATNVATLFDGQSWTPERVIYWGEGKSDVYAAFPRIEDLSDVNSQPFSVAIDQSIAAQSGASAAYELSDLLWAKSEGVSRTDGVVNLPMRHVMSRLVVRIVAGEKYIGSLPEDATILLHSTVPDARVDLEKGSVEKDPYAGTKSIKMRNLGIKTVGGVSGVTYEAIVVPQMLETSVPLIEIKSKSVSYLLEDSFSFRPGISYTYTATLNASTTAISVDIGCEVDDWNSTGGSGSGSGEGGGENPGEGDDDDGTVYTDLSTSGTANCYLISEAGNYKFKAVQGNTDGTVGNVKSVEVLWESFGTDVTPNVGDLIASVSYKDGYVRFKTPETFAQGNAVIAVKNSNGVILWSWHIWCSSEGWQAQEYHNNAGTMMDRNLGATSATPGDVGALGLLYQWGRKDPFLGSSSITGAQTAASTGAWKISLERISHTLAEENPMTFYTGSSNYLPNGSWDSKKTAYDPCPVGWRVPDGGETGVWANAFGSKDSFSASFDSNNRGFNFTGKLGDDSEIWYPASGYYSCDSGALDNVGNYGFYWSCSPNLNYDDGAWYFGFYGNGYVFPAYGYNVFRSYGGSVRCVRE